MHNSILDVTLLSAPVSATSEWLVVVWACVSLSLALSDLLLTDSSQSVPTWYFATSRLGPILTLGWTSGEQSGNNGPFVGSELWNVAKNCQEPKDDDEDRSWGASWKRRTRAVKAQAWPTGGIYPGYYDATPLQESNNHQIVIMPCWLARHLRVAVPRLQCSSGEAHDSCNRT